MAIKPDLRIAATARQAAATCANYISGILRGKVASGRATLAISGGNTPKPMFQDLAAAGLDWSRIHVFWVDERCVPPNSDQSNYKLANEALLRPAAVPESNVHRIFGELAPEQAAARYVEEIREFFASKAGELPAFDVIHRGIGNDVHTASLFPGEPLIGDRRGIAANVWVEKMKSHRVTLLPGVLEAAAYTVIQAEGTGKAEPIYNVLYGPDDPFQFPCQIAARNSPTTAWFIDGAAAAKVPAR